MKVEIIQFALILIPIVFLAAIFIINFKGMSGDERYAQIRGWLLQAVILAELEFGPGTGRLKLSSVYDKFVVRMPWVAQVITFDTFSKYVDNALEEMKTLLSSNEAISAIFKRKEIN